ncbi:MAG: hypothetical protein H6Q70_521 [Firmicutes bacterium]|nr:hypothetical protein [Bacillota bacterium]
MATLESSSTSVLDLVKQVVTFLTSEANFGTGNAWTLLRPVTVASITDEVILMGVGDGEDKIYLGMKIEDSTVNTGQVDIVLNGFGGFDTGLGWSEQPGAIPHTYLPTVPMVGDIRTNFWLSANTSRFILVVQLSTQFEMAYCGFLTPVSVERQYPYPLAIGGSYIQGKSWTSTTPGHSCFLNPGSDEFAGLGAYSILASDNANENTTSLRVRRPDGTWRSGLNKNRSDTTMHFEKLCVWPQNTEPTNTLTVLDTSLTIENVNMLPELLYETYPAGIIGQFDGVFFVGNREDLSSKETIIYNNKSYMVFNNVSRRDNDEYFAIQWY